MAGSGSDRIAAAPVVPVPPVRETWRESRLAPWFFLAPALLLISVFFFVPVVASLLLSFSDYDIYAVGDPANARFVGVITMIGYFQLFAEPYVMTQGGPLRSTTSLVLLMYEEGFRWWRMGNAAAIAFMLFIVILILTFLQLKWRPQTAR